MQIMSDIDQHIHFLSDGTETCMLIFPVSDWTGSRGCNDCPQIRIVDNERVQVITTTLSLYLCIYLSMYPQDQTWAIIELGSQEVVLTQEPLAYMVNEHSRLA